MRESFQPFSRSSISEVKETTLLVSNGSLAPAVCRYYKRNDVQILDSSGELAHGLNCPDSEDRFPGFDGFAKLVGQSDGRRTVTLILRADRYAVRKAELPKPTYEDIREGFAFLEY